MNIDILKNYAGLELKGTCPLWLVSNEAQTRLAREPCLGVHAIHGVRPAWQRGMERESRRNSGFSKT